MIHEHLWLIGRVKGDHILLRTIHQPNQDRYLVDPASSHMLVSKIKPCMSKYKSVI